MELTSIKPMDRTIEIVSPEASAHNLGIRVTLLSIDDDRMEKIKRGITNNRLALEARGKHFKAEDIEENNRDLLFTAITGWEWYNPTGNDAKAPGYNPEAMPKYNGEVPEFNKKNVMNMLKSVPWFHAQINEAVADTKAFFTNSKAV